MKIWNTRSGYDLIQVLAGRSNVFLLTDRQNNILIDTSIRLAWNKLDRRLKNLGIENIDYLILTHSHFDHAANAFSIREKYRAKVIIQANEAQFLTSGINHIPAGTGNFTRTLMNMAGYIAPLMRNKPCNYDILIESGYDLKPAGFNAYVMYTPGHSPGSSSLIIDDEIALVGDCMIGSFKSTVFPPFADDIHETFESWRKLLETKCTLFIPSHGKEIKRERVEKTLADLYKK
ncbi:MAG TPA: MBL fold metallo-hydrolase [Bacteroidales bacterium]|jgi:glyoxylase-like metal-dependent hydrolase (beta-lactamase superfamily II)|nr:MBL fold metallo-hydrolase [Bacteroidales bacterium]